MLINPKTGTTWAPDIRPEEIEEFDEEASDGAIAQYKAVDNHPILNKVLDKMAFFRTHAGAVWYNLLDRKTLLAKLNEMDAEILKRKTLKYVVTESVNLTIGTTRYAIFPADKIPGTRNYLFATIMTWGSSNTVFSVAGRDRTFWIIGDPDKIVNGIQLRLWYAE